MKVIAYTRAVLLLFLLTIAPAIGLADVDQQQLADFAERQGVHGVWPFVEAVERWRMSRQLPERYVTKEAARAHGWRGGGLCRVWPGHVIGGDEFGNFEKRLPLTPATKYLEADVDGTCSDRGPKRLILSSDGEVYITVDHYRTFAKVP